MFFEIRRPKDPQKLSEKGDGRTYLSIKEGRVMHLEVTADRKLVPSAQSAAVTVTKLSTEEIMKKGNVARLSLSDHNAS